MQAPIRELRLPLGPEAALQAQRALSMTAAGQHRQLGPDLMAALCREWDRLLLFEQEALWIFWQSTLLRLDSSGRDAGSGSIPHWHPPGFEVVSRAPVRQIDPERILLSQWGRAGKTGDHRLILARLRASGPEWQSLAANEEWLTWGFDRDELEEPEPDRLVFSYARCVHSEDCFGVTELDFRTGKTGYWVDDAAYQSRPRGIPRPAPEPSGFPAAGEGVVLESDWLRLKETGMGFPIPEGYPRTEIAYNRLWKYFGRSFPLAKGTLSLDVYAGNEVRARLWLRR